MTTVPLVKKTGFQVIGGDVSFDSPAIVMVHNLREISRFSKDFQKDVSLFNWIWDTFDDALFQIRI